MSTVIPAPAVAALNVQGSEQVFPVRRIYCVGRNYVEHAQEMGFTGREDPFFFCKPADAILNVLPGQVCDMPYPSRTQDLHHEIELVVALSKGGRDLTVEQAAECVWGYAVGLDMTRRDLQTQAKKAGRPWEVGKAFDHSAPTGPLVPRSRIGELSQGAITLDVNGERRQTGDLNQLIWNVAESIAYLSGLFELFPGDIIFTGTPAGVGSVERGDVMHGAIDGLGSIEVRLV
ncbi:fumarylacetoacetate hydrolase family protein [Alcaligenes nematophilus]|uniref:fumarylacetoacetate hydrolase family protein n=1 Tax=Alcaligenes nematophilus TaxID=2994643 RepID=UPI00245C47D7|nr:fumarylacetoacetate hydrolase family protein [Alcaligenes nematophilus]MDH4866051.1 fumarylacetoacetate hydrolase family protein [Bacillus cereus]MDY7127351.1 fumarylacetoacetate hydrolase family protein [Alcaligenes nematophilus]